MRRSSERLIDESSLKLDSNNIVLNTVRTIQHVRALRPAVLEREGVVRTGVPAAPESTPAPSAPLHAGEPTVVRGALDRSVSRHVLSQSVAALAAHAGYDGAFLSLMVASRQLM